MCSATLSRCFREALQPLRLDPQPSSTIRTQQQCPILDPHHGPPARSNHPNHRITRKTHTLANSRGTARRRSDPALPCVHHGCCLAGRDRWRHGKQPRAHGRSLQGRGRIAPTPPYRMEHQSRHSATGVRPGTWIQRSSPCEGSARLAAPRDCETKERWKSSLQIRRLSERTHISHKPYGCSLCVLPSCWSTISSSFSISFGLGGGGIQ